MTITSYFSDKKPKNGSYILGNSNHVGWYLNGYVYYWAFDCRKGYPRCAKLKDWCDAWLYLKPCCIASEKEYRETMGVIEGLEPENYREFEVEKETKREIEKKLKIAVKALEYYANQEIWADGIDDTSEGMFCFENSLLEENGFETAQAALKEINECHL